MTQFKYYSLAESDMAHGTVVVIDVLRAFTTAAYAFNAGAEKIFPVGSVDAALQLKEYLEGALTMGEVNGYKPEAFDFDNSPLSIANAELRGRSMIHRTSAGTQGLISAVNAEKLLAASFVVAKSTADYLKKTDPDVIAFLITGNSLGRDGDEDLACAEYIQSLVKGKEVDPTRYTERVWTSSVGRDFLNGESQYLREKDILLSLKANLFPFFMRATQIWGRIVLKAVLDEY